LHYWKSKFLCVPTTTRNIGEIFLTANQQANPDRNKMTEKLQLPVGLPTEIIFLTEFFCAITHKKIRICQVKESVETHFLSVTRQYELINSVVFQDLLSGWRGQHGCRAACLSVVKVLLGTHRTSRVLLGQKAQRPSLPERHGAGSCRLSIQFHPKRTLLRGH